MKIIFNSEHPFTTPRVTEFAPFRFYRLVQIYNTTLDLI